MGSTPGLHAETRQTKTSAGLLRRALKLLELKDSNRLLRTATGGCLFRDSSKPGVTGTPVIPTLGRLRQEDQHLDFGQLRGI